MSHISYYELLEVPRGATDVEIKKAFRKLAMRWHPDKNPDCVEEASKRFQNIGEAYDVLSDAKKRAVYDQYGYEGLIDGIESNHSDAYSYKNNAQELFDKFFGASNPFASFGFGDAAPFATKLNKAELKKPEPAVHNLECTLTELYRGCSKKFVITRKRFGPDGELRDDQKSLTINVKPGWKKGTKITFPGEGDESSSFLAQDVEFVIQEGGGDAAYQRDGNNLIYTHKISLADALTDCSLQIPTLDGRVISIACPEVVSPVYEKLIVGEGMPISKRPGSKGDLIVKFHILFPKYLNGVKRNKIRELLANEELQN